MPSDQILDAHILSIIQKNSIREQTDLQQHLKRSGYEVPQATLSRRLKKLKIAKVSGIYQLIDFNQVHLPIILNVQISEFGLVVLHTHPGQASSLAYFFDRKYVNYMPLENKASVILGTIAGDDTVLLIVRRNADIQTVLSWLQSDFPYLPLQPL